MAGRKRKESAEQVDQPDTEVNGGADVAADSAATRTSASREGSGVPRWRQIEVMHERAQLRKMLDDLVMDFDELEMEVFGSDAEHDLLYRHLGEEDEDDEEDDDLELDDSDDDFEDDDFDDLED